MEEVLNIIEESFEEKEVDTNQKEKSKKNKNKKYDTEKQEKYMTEKCKIIKSYKDTIVIVFKEKCISFTVKENVYKENDLVEVQYKGTIGKKDFKIKLN